MAGGSAAVVQKAGDKFAEGHCEEALHLLDILREAQAETAASRALYAEIHEQLQAGSDNFWLSSWLKQQAKLARD